MVAPLRLGIAGLGTVGASVVRLIANEQSALLARTDRRIVVVAVTARSKSKKRDIDLRKIAGLPTRSGLRSIPRSMSSSN